MCAHSKCVRRTLLAVNESSTTALARSSARNRGSVSVYAIADSAHASVRSTIGNALCARHGATGTKHARWESADEYSRYFTVWCAQEALCRRRDGRMRARTSRRARSAERVSPHATGRCAPDPARVQPVRAESCATHSACARKPAGWGRRLTFAKASRGSRCAVPSKCASRNMRTAAPMFKAAPDALCDCTAATRTSSSAKPTRRRQRERGTGLDGPTGADGQPAALLSGWRMQACRLRGCACKCAVGAVLRVGPSQAGELAGAVRRLRALRRSRLKSLRLLISLTSTPTLLIAIERDWQQ